MPTIITITSLKKGGEEDGVVSLRYRGNGKNGLVVLWEGKRIREIVSEGIALLTKSITSAPATPRFNEDMLLVHILQYSDFELEEITLPSQQSSAEETHRNGQIRWQLMTEAIRILKAYKEQI